MLNEDLRKFLLELARRSIRNGLQHGAPIAVDVATLAPELQKTAACFVTLEKQGQLRGCIGMLEPVRPLAQDVAHNAYAAAFSDPRFTPVTAKELDELAVHISILGDPSAMTVTSEADLIGQLRPGVDGLILQDGARRATFLPSVWEGLPDPRQFVAHLKQKAGWTKDYWSPTLRAYRYETEQFG